MLSAKNAATQVLQRLCLVCRPPFNSSIILIRCYASISLATLSPFHPPTCPRASFSPLSWHWADLQPEDSKRGIEDGRKVKGGRKHESKTLEKERVWEGGGARERKRQTVKQWSGCSCYHQGNRGRSAETEKERKEKGKEGVLINMALGRFAIPPILSLTLYHFLHQLPTH